MLLPLLALGCAITSPHQPFADVQADVAQRTGYQVEWNRFQPGASAIDAGLSDLLSRPLTPESAVQIALLNNPRVQALYARLGIAQAELVQAGLLKNPVFHGAFRWAPGSQRLFDFSVVQDFLDVLTLPLEVSIAERELESTKLEVASQVISLAARTKREFYGYLAAEEMLASYHASVTAAEASFEMAEQLRSAGNVPLATTLNEQAKLERTRLALARVEIDRYSRRERLNRLMGLWGDRTAWTAGSDLPEPPEPPVDPQSVERRALASSLDLAEAYVQIEIAARRFQLVGIMRAIPSFDLGGNLEFEKEETFRLIEHRRREGARYELDELPGPTELWSGAEASIALPIFDQGQAAQAAGRAEIDRRYERYKAIAIEVRSAAREAAYRAAGARSQAAYHASVVTPLYETITADMQLRYNAMFDGVFELLKAKNRELAARRERIRAKADYWLAHADLEELLMGGTPDEFRGGLERETSATRGFMDGSNGFPGGSVDGHD